VLVVAGLSLKNLQPRVWDAASPYYLPNLRAVMVSYADFYRRPRAREAAMEQGLRLYLGIPRAVEIYLDNGAFYFLKRGGTRPTKEYEAFVARARPDWYPIPGDFIPAPVMDPEERHACFTKTMAVNRAYERDGFVPVIHIGPHLDAYMAAIKSNTRLAAKPGIAFGGIVPNLLRAPEAAPYNTVLDALRRVRQSFPDKQLHVFGIGGTATLHLAALLGMDSVDSSGWRNRAARGIVQLPGSGDRTIAKMGNWRGREPSEKELESLVRCQCPACLAHGPEGLKAKQLAGFCNRATHNLYVLLKEADEIERRLEAGTYGRWYKDHLDNSIYLPLVERTLTRSHLPGGALEEVPLVSCGTRRSLEEK
jgi:hypothetical protein